MAGGMGTLNSVLVLFKEITMRDGLKYWLIAVFAIGVLRLLGG